MAQEAEVLDTDAVDKDILVLQTTVNARLRPNLFTPIITRSQDGLLETAIPVNRGVLSDGIYGTGKDTHRARRSPALAVSSPGINF